MRTKYLQRYDEMMINNHDIFSLWLACCALIWLQTLDEIYYLYYVFSLHLACCAWIQLFMVD